MVLVLFQEELAPVVREVRLDREVRVVLVPVVPVDPVVRVVPAAPLDREVRVVLDRVAEVAVAVAVVGTGIIPYRATYSYMATGAAVAAAVAVLPLRLVERAALLISAVGREEHLSE